MADDDKELEIRYLRAIIDDMRNQPEYQYLDRNKKFCHHCLREFEALDPKKPPVWKNLLDGIAYGVLILVFLFAFVLTIAFLTI